MNEEHADIAILIKNTINYKGLDDFENNILAVNIETTRSSIGLAIATNMHSTDRTLVTQQTLPSTMQYNTNRD